MTLLEYIRSPGNSAASLATKAGIAPAYLYQIAHGTRTANAALARRIQDCTNGAVMCWDLRPNDWHMIWPELLQRQDAPKVIESREGVA